MKACTHIQTRLHNLQERSLTDFKNWFICNTSTITTVVFSLQHLLHLRVCTTSSSTLPKHHSVPSPLSIYHSRLSLLLITTPTSSLLPQHLSHPSILPPSWQDEAFHHQLSQKCKPIYLHRGDSGDGEGWGDNARREGGRGWRKRDGMGRRTGSTGWRVGQRKGREDGRRLEGWGWKGRERMLEVLNIIPCKFITQPGV